MVSMGMRLGCMCWSFMVCLAFACMVLVLVVDGSADIEDENGSVFDPRWQLITRKNFSTQIRQHEFALLMVTYPWSGESRALRNDLVQLMKHMHAQFQRLRLMLIYRNVEKLLGDVLVGDKAVNLVFYRESVPFKYSGKLSAQNILASVWHAMSVPSGDLPFKQLNTLEDFEFFLQSTDKAVLLLDICGWVPKISATDNKNTRLSTTTKTSLTNLNQEEVLERDGSDAKKSTAGSQLKPKCDNSIQSGVNVGGDKNTKTSPISALLLTENHGFVREHGTCETSEGSSAALLKDGLHWASYGNDSIETETNTAGVSNWQGIDHSSSHALFHGSSCTLEEYDYFEVLYTNLSRIARDNMLPPERQRFGLLSNRTVISALRTIQDKSLLMLQFPDCPNCSKTFDRGNDLEEFVLTSHPLVTELQGEGYKLVPPLSAETASLILFIDRTSPSARLRQRSKAALQEFRQVAFQYLLSYLSDKRKNTREDKSLSETYSRRKARKKTLSPLSKHVQMQVLKSPELLKWLNSEENMVFQVKAADRGIQIVHRKSDGGLVRGSDQILNYFLKQENSGTQLNQDKLGELAKKAGLQLLSGEFPLDTDQVSHIPETISSLIEEEIGRTEEDFKESERKKSLETQEQHKKLGDTMDNNHRHSLTSKHISDNEIEKQDTGIVLNDMILVPEGYDVKYEHSTTQESSARPWPEQCKNELSTTDSLDNNSNQGCKTERIEDSGDKVTYLKESVNRESVAEEYVPQKLDVYDKKRILPEIGDGEQNQDIYMIEYTEEKALFEKKSEDFDKLDDRQDQNYDAGISFFYSEGGDQLRTILSSDASIPLVVLIDPVKQSHYPFPKDIPVTYSSLFDFITSFLNGTVKEYKHSEAFPPSPREPPRPPFVNRDFHEVDSIPRVTVGTFSRLVIGLEGCNETIETSCASSHQPGAAWGKDVLVIFSSDWCGFCKRSELVVREVHRFFAHCRNSMHVEGEIALNSSAREMLSTEIHREKSTVDVSKDEMTKGDHFKHEATNGFPSIFQIDCTLNDCSSLLKSLNQKQKELYPALLLFPAGKKDDPVAYKGDISVNEVIEFLASYGSVSSHLYSLKGVHWNKMQQGGGSLNTCAPWTSSSIPIQIEAPLHMQRTGQELSLSIFEQYGSNQFQAESNGKFSLQKESQKPTVGSVLVASEKLQGVYPFENSIIIVVKADFKEGFQGLIVNKPLLWDDLPKIYMQLEPLLRPTPIYLGGPIIVNGMPFLSLTRIVNLEGFLEVLPGIYYGDPKVTGKTFQMIQAGKVQAHDFCFFLGFTNWGWQQLFDEVAAQAWHLNTYREDVVRWPAR